MGSTSAGWIHAWLNRRFMRLDHVWPEYDYICKNTNVLTSYRELFLCPKQIVHNPMRSTKRLKQSDSAEMTLAATRSTEPECKNQFSQRIYCMCNLFWRSTKRGIHTDNSLFSSFVNVVSHDFSQLQRSWKVTLMNPTGIFSAPNVNSYMDWHEDDWNFHLNGFTFECGIFHKRKPVVLKFSRVQDASWQPFQLHVVCCSKWGKGVDRAMRSGRTKEQVRQ